MIKLALTLCLVLSSQLFASDDIIFRSATTIDGHPIQYADITKVQLEFGQGDMATAIYNEQGAFILYNPKIIENVSPLAQYLILEHERAHHRLGHSLITKLSREGYLERNTRFYSTKEKDSDCEAGYALKEDINFFSKIERKDIHQAMVQIYEQIGGNLNEPLPSWLLSRIDTIDLCFKGKLLKRPTPIEVAPITSKMYELLKKPTRKMHGPNCWNSALYLSGLSRTIRYSSNREFNVLMESAYCKTVSKPLPMAIKAYRVNLEGVRNEHREIHASLILKNNLTFNKMTVYSTSKYQIERNETVDETYLYTTSIRNFEVINENGERSSTKCPTEKCLNEIVFKKCQDLNQINSDFKKTAYRESLEKLNALEDQISSFLFKDILPDFLKIETLKSSLDELEELIKTQSPEDELESWQQRYLLSVAHSLSEQLIMKQPQWLN
ncbi:MAG: hypothetical protein OHK0056_31320 [Bacteriovoracaceae bacterium]